VSSCGYRELCRGYGMACWCGRGLLLLLLLLCVVIVLVVKVCMVVIVVCVRFISALLIGFAFGTGVSTGFRFAMIGRPDR